MLFQSDRIQLRKITSEDAELYHTWRNDMEVMHATNPTLDVYSIEETREFVDNVLVNSQSGKCYMMVDVESQTPFGVVSLINIDSQNRHAECIIDIGDKNFWGKGYGPEGLTLLLRYAFLELNLHRISLRVFSFNERAIRAYEKIGFTHEGISRESLFRDGTWHDIVHMGMLQREFLHIHKN